jgi:hypothetical protein
MADENVRAQHEQVVSTKVLGKASGPAHFLRNMGQSISGVASGFAMLVIAIGLIIAAVKLVPDNSSKVAELKLSTAEEAKNKTGMVKVQSEPTIVTPVVLSFKTKNELSQEVPQTFGKSAIYLKAEYQIFEQIKKVEEVTSTATENGQEVEKTSEKTTITEDWVKKSDVENFATFTLGGITVDTNGAKKKFDLTEEIIPNVILPVTATAQVYENPSAEIGKTRLVINYVPVTDNILVVGEISDNDKINGGETFIISNYTDTELVSKLRSEENTMTVGLRVVAWFFLTIGFTSIIGPILVLTNLIPGVNKIISCLAFIIFGVISAGIVLFVTLVVQYWWLVILCLVLLLFGLVGLAIYMLTKKKK